VRELHDGTPWASDVRRAAAILYAAGARAVWLFGSRAGDKAADRLSDFDLAVEGLPIGAGAISQASRELRGKVDIVRVESATPALRWGIAHSRIIVPPVALADAAMFRSRPPLPDSLAGMRIRAAAELIREVGAASVIDFGCGHGWLLAELVGDAEIEGLTGVDFSPDAITATRRRIARALGPAGAEKTKLQEGIFTHRDPFFLDHDAATALEVIEHLDAPQLDAFVGVLFDYVRPARAVLTTPNVEYNVVWFTHRPNGRRHPDHRFEWSRAEFAKWAGKIAAAHRYQVRIRPVGSVHPTWGPPTQLAVFDRCE
jgi:2-polyprenyl-3-methyl-5-hydroxy-6-metoxy-1,4-benzoquinol methylase